MSDHYHEPYTTPSFGVDENSRQPCSNYGTQKAVERDALLCLQQSSINNKLNLEAFLELQVYSTF